MEVNRTERFTTADSKTSTTGEGDAEKDKSEPIGRPRVTHLQRRNICNIISNRFPGHEKGLPQNELDERKISSTFSWLNFEIDPHIDLTSEEIKEKVIELSKADYSENDCFVLFLLSHGDDKRQIQGADLEMVEIDWIIDRLVGGKTHKSLRNIPKLFFIQTCRGDIPMPTMVTKYDDVTKANLKTVRKAEKSDMFVFYSTTQGNVAHLGSLRGSFFINVLCQVLQEYCADGTLHLGDVATKVNDMLSIDVVRTQQGQMLAQVSEVSHTLTSHVYFHPKGTYKEFMETYKDP